MNSEKSTEYQKDTSTESHIQTYSRRDFFKIAGILGATTALTNVPTGLVQKVLASTNRPPSEQAQIDFYSTDEAINHIFNSLKVPNQGFTIKDKAELSNKELLEMNQTFREIMQQAGIKNSDNPIKRCIEVSYGFNDKRFNFLGDFGGQYLKTSAEESDYIFLINSIVVSNDPELNELIGFQIKENLYFFGASKNYNLKGMIQSNLKQELNKDFIQTIYFNENLKQNLLEKLSKIGPDPRKAFEITNQFKKHSREFFN